MRWMTGADRAQYEQVLASLAASTAKATLLENALDALHERLKALRKDWEYERERGDKAVDALLQSKGLPPVMPDGPPPAEEPDPFREDPAERQRWLAAHGLTDPRMESGA